jgi:Transposase DDE domain
MLAEAAAVDAAEDAEHGPGRRGDELPAALAERGSRLARFQEARRQLAAAEAAREAEVEAQLARRAEREAATGRPSGGRPPRADAVRRRAWDQRNTTDPDARKMKAMRGWVTGYNAQAAVSEDGLVLAATVSQHVHDATHLAPMLGAAIANAREAGIEGRIGRLVADAGYWSEANAASERRRGPRLLIPPHPGPPRKPRQKRRKEPPGRARMERRLARPAERARYRRRAGIVEPVFGHIKEVLGVRRFSRRGRVACEREWALVCTAHNLLKWWRHGQRASQGTPGPGPRPIAHRSARRGPSIDHTSWPPDPSRIACHGRRS